LLGAEKASAAYAGAEIDNWIAPALTEANPSPVPWTKKELFNYLRTGLGPLHGAATAATMTPVIREGLGVSKVPESDVRALAIYFADIDRASVHEIAVEPAVKTALATSYLGSDQEYDPDARLYASACISCHYNSGPAPRAARPELALNSALTLSEPTNFIQTVLNGIGNTEGAPGLVMPAYASSLSDAEIASLAAYLRRTRTKLPPWTDLENKVAAIRQQTAASH
jgi:mono/diheme cytochrome c family protein